MPDVMAALRRTRTMEQEIGIQIEHIERLHRIAARAGNSSSFAAETAEKLSHLERQLNKTIDEMCDAKREALEYISYLNGEERAVIEGYYILAKTWQKLSNELYMSERRMFMLRKSGLAKLVERYGEKAE